MSRIDELAAYRRPTATLPLCSDEALALKFVEQHADDLRYTALWGRWHAWHGSRWAADNTLDVFDRIRKLCRSTIEAHPTLTPADARTLSDASTVTAVERLARCDRRLAATVDQWDADPWLLTTPCGTVDLRAGTMWPEPCDFITKSTAVAPDFQADCPRWRAFLRRVTNDDPDLIEYLQRLLGYCLTGSVREHILAFFYGTGANGKGTLINSVTAILGDYVTVAPANMFEATTTDRHPTDLAMLRGARLVAAQETEQGRRWAESRIKSLTGGDPITARFMRQDFFTFQPSFKLVIAGNYKPGLRSVDEAVRQRLHLVPFTVQIPPEERDNELVEKLREEWPAILAWMIDGCQKWQEDGLRPPVVILTATDEYLQSCDAFSPWLSDCTQCAAAYCWESSAELFGLRPG